jgi:CHAT domain-containing protein
MDFTSESGGIGSRTGLTAKLIGEFSNMLAAGQTKAEALRNVQLSMIKAYR